MVRSVNPVLITNQHFMLLDKFGTDMSAQSLPMANPFGMPAKLNEANKYSSYLRAIWNRNSGETETRLRVSQVGAKETVKQLAMGYSPELRNRMAQRIIRADDPMNINQIIKPDEYGYNRAVRMSSSMLSDSGYTLRHEVESDRTEPNLVMATQIPIVEDLSKLIQPENLAPPAPKLLEDHNTLIRHERLTAPVVKDKVKRNPAPAIEADVLELIEQLSNENDVLEGIN
jgi:hypothetical protein